MTLEERKSHLRSWLYQMLAKLETCDNVIANRSEMGNTDKIIVIWDKELKD